ncbi:hypothetical protein LUW76_24975 [Actinomadura madurae]|uniref:hypothetical protein n=1 Tax=Actinomadura madurae TaxID=1993 RepID=UPI0020263DE4|nr:hypothetical protein [Actinomadura madurae]URM97342.1 hypothetical protein LUW76_24975 [Actinomadura madurae]
MRPPRRLTALGLAAIAVLSLTTPPASAAEVQSYIHNSVYNPVGIGVIYDWDDGGALYDRILPVGRRTDREFGWVQAEGFYIGPGFCAWSYYKKNGQEYGYHQSERGQLRTPTTPEFQDSDGIARWQVTLYQQSSC